MDTTKPPRRTGRGDRSRRKIRRFVQEFSRREGYPPSQRQIADAVALSVSTVCYHVTVMDQQGAPSAAATGSRARSWNPPIPPPSPGAMRWTCR